MTTVTQIEVLKEVVLRTLAELGMPQADWSLVHQKSLHRDREHAGTRFEYRGVRAVWYPDRQVIDFFGEDGHFLASVPVHGQTLPHAA